MNHLKDAATKKLAEEGIHPFRHAPKPSGALPKCFARGGWSVFLDSPADVERSIRYVENNPVKEGPRPQSWPFVVPVTPDDFPPRIV